MGAPAGNLFWRATSTHPGPKKTLQKKKVAAEGAKTRSQHSAQEKKKDLLQT